MSELNSRHNRCVWFDVPVADLDRAIAFYSAVLGVPVERNEFGGSAIGVIDHEEGNGGCLVPCPEDVGAKGPLVYLNANGRIRAAVEAVVRCGGKVLEPVHGIGPHGFRSVVTDSEGNRVALHSHEDR